MKNKLFLLFTFIFLTNILPQTNSIEIEVKNEPWTTGDIFSNLNSREVYDGDIRAGNGEIFFWADMRGWAEFNLPSNLDSKNITNLKLKFFVSDESTANDNTIPGSHNLIITKFPFDVRINSVWEIIEYFDELEYNDPEKIYGVDWIAGESIGIKEITLGEKAIEDFILSVKQNRNFKIGFWEFNDNASKCTISGKGSEFPPRLIVHFDSAQ
ncbi:MAG: hypothetical protein L3J41_00505 [Melioribacteraceae bacterium]|nr:hypothetical protein [Melioribacteraceae bacterium]